MTPSADIKAAAQDKNKDLGKEKLRTAGTVSRLMRGKGFERGLGMVFK